MATEQGFVDHLCTQCGLGAAISYRRMFGEYALYVRGTVVAFACDNQLYLKPTEAGRALLAHVAEHPPYPGAKMHFRLDDEIEDRPLLRRLFEATAAALPPPKPAKPPSAKAPGKTAGKRPSTGKPKRKPD